MACLRCHREVAAEAAYCPACGARQYSDEGWRGRRLVRVRSEEKIAGVCAGLAHYFDVDVTLVRILWVALSIVPGSIIGSIIGGIVAYALAWIVMPAGEAAPITARRLVRSTTDVKIAGVCGGLGEYLGVDATPIRVLWIVASLIPPVLVAGLIAYVAAWLIVPKASSVLLPQQQTHAA